MTDIIVRAAEGCAPDSALPWDSVWDADRGFADWAIAVDEPQNIGGLQARAAIATAVTLSLFTDKRIDPTHPLYFLADGDPRGYWGDGVSAGDAFEDALGSHLWLLERAPLLIKGVPAATWAKQFATEALAPLISQGAAVRVEIETSQNELRSRLEMIVRLYGRDGETVFDRKFELLWKQVTG